MGATVGPVYGAVAVCATLAMWAQQAGAHGLAVCMGALAYAGAAAPVAVDCWQARRKAGAVSQRARR